MNPRPLPPQVVAALKVGHKMEAIKELQMATGVGLKEARDWIEAFQRAGPAAAAAPPPAADRPGMNVKGTHRIPIEAVNAMRDGRVIEAIRILRASGNYGLAEAKGIIDQALREMPHARPVHTHTARRRGLSPGEVARDGGAGKWLALLCIAAVVIAFVLYR